MKEDYSIDMQNHRSRLLIKEDIAKAFAIIPVKKDLGSFIASQFPNALEKMKYFANDISDPWHAPINVYRQCAFTINTLLDEILLDLCRK
jgi:protein-tyrosine-phosphatase